MRLLHILRRDLERWLRSLLLQTHRGVHADRPQQGAAPSGGGDESYCALGDDFDGIHAHLRGG